MKELDMSAGGNVAEKGEALLQRRYTVCHAWFTAIADANSHDSSLFVQAVEKEEKDSEREVPSATARSFETTSRVLPSPPFVVSLVVAV
jgi:hypothetical protein